MKWTFATLAGLNALALAASFAVGVLSKLNQGLGHPEDPTFLVHFTLGLLTAIATLFVHCLIFTYFLGTGRWVKEVGQAYRLPDEGWPRTTRELKRRTFPPALFAMLSAIATVAAGAGAQRQEWPWQIHAALATATLLINAWAYVVEYRNLRANGLVLQAVLRDVDRIRREHGLPSNAEALKREGA